MNKYDLPNTIAIGKDSFEKINRSGNVVRELVDFLKEHSYSSLNEYADLFQFSGYEDETQSPLLIVMKSSVNGDEVTIAADLQYSLLEQQNSCADSLNSVTHSARIIYSYTKNESEITFDHDSDQIEEGYYPGEYGG